MQILRDVHRWEQRTVYSVQLSCIKEVLLDSWLCSTDWFCVSVWHRHGVFPAQSALSITGGFYHSTDDPPQSARSGCHLLIVVRFPPAIIILKNSLRSATPFQGRKGGFAARVARLATPTRLSWLIIYEQPTAMRLLASPGGKLDFLTIGTSEPIGKKAWWGAATAKSFGFLG